jgi:nucleoside-diphosphate-sugar epimerase
VTKFVVASSSSVYGDSAEGPAREDGVTGRPLSPYAASKKAAEVLTHSYHHLHGLDVSALRYFTVYGPAGRPDMSVLRFVRWIATGHPVTLYGDGSQERDFTYVDDIARGTIAALKPVGCEAFNLGSDRPFTVAALISMIEEAVGRKAVIDRRPAHRADVRATWADISKARSVLGWSPQVSLEEGLRKTVAWYMANRELADSLELEAAPATAARTRRAAA